MGSHAHSPIELDALIVGAGFGGVYQLKTLRDMGYKVKLVEMGSDYGGVWFWNRYPGARVDSPIPFYEFDDPELWKDWTWKQRYPSSGDLRAYFAYVANKSVLFPTPCIRMTDENHRKGNVANIYRRWDLRKDTQFNTTVASAVWDNEQLKWTIETKQGYSFKAKYFLLNTGFAAKRYIPDWKGIESFKGIFLHPSYWPHENLDLEGKRVAVIGTGSTGVQIAQALAPVAGELVVFQRTPNTALPMGQVNYSNGDQAHPKEAYPDLYHARKKSFGGFDFNFLGRGTFQDPPEARKVQYEQLWKEGDFKFWLATYQDMLFEKKANDEAYAFWRDKTRARIRDRRVQDILAPMEAPYPFGCKRIQLESGFFEIFDQPHVSLVDINSTPIEGMTKNGVKTSEKEWSFDFIICATGFDSLTGGLTQIDIRGTTGESLKEHWKNGTYTYLGMASSGFPNLFFTYGPQAPAAFCNGPTCAQVQGDWIASMMEHMKQQGLGAIEALRSSEEKWRQIVLDIGNSTLLPAAKSVCPYLPHFF